MNASQRSRSSSPQSNPSYGLSLGIGIGLPLGLVIGLLTDNVGVWLSAGLAIGIAFGLIYDERQKKARAAQRVKVLDGATYTLVMRTDPHPGQRHHFWLGDNGHELELTDAEAAELT